MLVRLWRWLVCSGRCEAFETPSGDTRFEVCPDCERWQLLSRGVFRKGRGFRKVPAAVDELVEVMRAAGLPGTAAELVRFGASMRAKLAEFGIEA